MATSPMIIRISADQAELRRNIAESKNLIEGLAPSIAGLQARWAAHAQRLVQDAHNITAALQDVGAKVRIADLTSRDAAAALAKLDAAMAQLHASGKPVPPLMAQTAEEIRKLHPPATAASAVLEKLTGGLLRFAGPAAIGLAVKNTISWADTLSEASVQTGIGVEQLQRLEYAAKLNGSSLEGLTGAVTKMLDRIAGGDTSAVAAVTRLGLGFDSLRALTPDEQLLQLGDALARVTDQGQRVSLAVDLFGKSGAQLLPTLLGLRGAMADAPIVAQENIAALGELQDIWDGLKVTGLSVIAEVLGPLAQAFLGVKGAIDRALESAKKWAQQKWGAKPGEETYDISSVAAARESQLRDLRKRELAELTKVLGLKPLGVEAEAAALKILAGELPKAPTAPTLPQTSPLVVPPTVGKTAAQIAAGEAANKYADQLAKIADHLYGRDALAKLTEWEKAIGNLNKIVDLAPEIQDEWRKAVEAAERAVGHMTPELQRFGAAIPLASRPLPVSYALAPSSVSGVMTSQLPVVGTDLSTTGAAGVTYAPGAVSGVNTTAVLNAGRLAAASAIVDASFDNLIRSFVSLAQVAGDSTSEFARAIGTLMTTVQLARDAGDQMRKGWIQFTTEGGDKLKGAMGMISGLISGAAAIYQAGQTTSRAANVAGAAMTGAQVGYGVAGYTGAAVGGGIGALYGWLSKAPERAVNNARDAYIAAAGGLAALNIEAAKAGTSLDWLLTARNVKDFEKAVASLEGSLAKYKSTLGDIANLQGQATEIEGQLANLRKQEVPTWQEMEQLAGKYGIDVKVLGQNFQQMKTTDMARSILSDFERLVAGGTDWQDVLNGTYDDINKLVWQAQQYGTELPENMRPALEAMAKQGLLTDEAGNKIKDLNGLKFGPNIKTDAELLRDQIGKLQTKFDELIGKLGELIGKLSNIPASLPDPFQGWVVPPIPGEPIPEPPKPPGPEPLPEPPPREYHHGGLVGAWVTAHGGALLGSLERAQALAATVPAAHGGLLVPRRLLPGDIPILAQQDEGILSRDVGMPALGRWALAAINRGQTPGGGPGGGMAVTVNANISAWDSDSVRSWLRRGGADELTDEIVTRLPVQARRRVGLR